MNYDEFFADAIGRLWHERRYRVFADLERIAGRFPRAIWHSPQGPREVMRNVSIMHVLSEPTSSSSGAHMSGSPLNSGGLPTTMSGFPAAESIPRRAELQVLLAL